MTKWRIGQVGSPMTLNRIDQVSPDAPQFAGYGPMAVGVQTLHLINPAQLDLSVAEMPSRDRPLTVEVWYPAQSAPATPYDTLLRDGVTAIQLQGRAARGAVAIDGDFPLVILSHGYPGDRLLMGHLGETLASRGYIVASIAHRDSGYADKGAFISTLVHRPLDTRFVADHFGAKSYAIIGYSMGGYGALVAAGAGVRADAFDHLPYGQAHLPTAPQVDPRLKAIIPIGPWGGKHGAWNAQSLAAMQVPSFIMAGSADDVSGYADGMVFIHAHAGGHLLTFDGAGHNAAAPFPAPLQALIPSPHLDFLPAEHYSDPVWDTVRMNGIAQHFATVFLGLHLKGDPEMAAYLTPDFKGFTMRQGLRLQSQSKAR
jgi:predicted dienelactone hydrolase